jgi:hypothetical protein
MNAQGLDLKEREWQGIEKVYNDDPLQFLVVIQFC